MTRRVADLIFAPYKEAAASPSFVYVEIVDAPSAGEEIGFIIGCSSLATRREYRLTCERTPGNFRFAPSPSDR